jgi:copper chaperone CopZ
MKFSKLIFAVLVSCFILTSCNTEEKIKVTKTSQKEAIAANTQKVSLHISGMTCEIGCAKTIQSKLSKKEGVAAAKVVFKDSLATVEYDANKISKAELIDFVDGIAGGDLYKASEATAEK